MGELGLLEELCSEEEVLKHKGSHPIINIVKVEILDLKQTERMINS